MPGNFLGFPLLREPKAIPKRLYPNAIQTITIQNSLNWANTSGFNCSNTEYLSRNRLRHVSGRFGTVPGNDEPGDAIKPVTTRSAVHNAPFSQLCEFPERALSLLRSIPCGPDSLVFVSPGTLLAQTWYRRRVCFGYVFTVVAVKG